MLNTDATHLPGDVFSTPGFILEVDPARQFTGLGPDGRDDPDGDAVRDNPLTPDPDSNYLRYLGDQHVVLGGSEGDDVLIASEGDDTITGEDISEVFAGPGNDFILGAKTNEPNFGNEGDDWIQLGTQDGAPGDNLDPGIQDPIIGNDVL